MGPFVGEDADIGPSVLLAEVVGRTLVPPSHSRQLASKHTATSTVGCEVGKTAAFYARLEIPTSIGSVTLPLPASLTPLATGDGRYGRAPVVRLALDQIVGLDPWPISPTACTRLGVLAVVPEMVAS